MAAGARDGELRLVGGRRDPEGAWEYGRIEFRYAGFLLGLQDTDILGFDLQVLGRRGALVACRELGYSVGVEAVAGRRSALSGPAGVSEVVSRIFCQGSEDRLQDCEVFGRVEEYNLEPLCEDRGDCNAALICSNPSGALFGHVPTNMDYHL